MQRVVRETVEAVATQNLMRFNLRGEGDLVEDTAHFIYEINANTEGVGL